MSCYFSRRFLLLFVVVAFTVFGMDLATNTFADDAKKTAASPPDGASA